MKKEHLIALSQEPKTLGSFFETPHILTANESIYPQAETNRYKGNRGRERCDLIGLDSDSDSFDSISEDLLIDVTLESIENA